jgi:hypothetical protein
MDCILNINENKWDIDLTFAVVLNKTNTMADKSFKLIEGTFDAHDAAEVLLSVLSDKINFHEVQILSCQERNSDGGEYSKKRFNELLQVREEITAMVQDARDKGLRLDIESTVNINLIKA